MLIKLGLQDRLFLGNLDAKHDWGHVKDYVEMQWLMLQQESPEDFVDAAATELGMTIRWQGSGVEGQGSDSGSRCIVAVDPRYFRPTEVETLLGDPTKARE